MAVDMLAGFRSHIFVEMLKLIPLVVLIHPCVVAASSNQLGVGLGKHLASKSSHVFAMTDVPPERLMS